MSNMLLKYKDQLILHSRLMLMLLFLLSGIMKIHNFHNTVGYMGSIGVSFPEFATLLAIVVEIFGSIALIGGIFTRPIALLFIPYTLMTGLIGHHYWTETGFQQMVDFMNFYKNISIMGCFLLLAIIGPGKYSIDSLMARNSSD